MAVSANVACFQQTGLCVYGGFVFLTKAVGMVMLRRSGFDIRFGARCWEVVFFFFSYLFSYSLSSTSICITYYLLQASHSAIRVYGLAF